MLLRRHQRNLAPSCHAAWVGIALLALSASLRAQTPAIEAPAAGTPRAATTQTGAPARQDAGASPAAIPAGASAALPTPVNPTPVHPPLTPRQAREAESAYLAGARSVDHQNYDEAERSFARAVALNPDNRDYALALVVTREHRVTELVQQAAKAQLAQDPQRAEALLNEARRLDPQNSVVLQHFGPGGLLPGVGADYARTRSDLADTLGGAPKLVPTPGRKSIHQRSGAPELLRAVYASFGIRLTLDPSVKSGAPIRFDLEDVDFGAASEVAQTLTHTFVSPLTDKTALAADDTPENRDRLLAQVEETIFLPGTPVETINELATLARSVFDLKQVTASPGSGTLLVRGEPETLHLLNATYDGMLGGGSDVFLDLKLYELNRSRTRDIGGTLPSSAGAFNVASTAQQLVSANQTVVNQAIAQGAIKLTGNTLTDLITEAAFLIGSGVATSAQYSNLLGLFGGGLTLSGVYLGSGATVNLLLTSSEVRLLDAVQLRAGERQPSSFRVGTRYPIVTSTYSSGLTGSLASAAAGATINGSSVSSLLSQFLGSSAVTVPQIQFEDLGLTLKTTPQVLRDQSVTLQLDLKLEALGGGTINNIPILNSRTLTSSVTVPTGQTALLISQVSSSELRALQGLPGLNELPGFGGTDRNTQKATGELLITVTPRVVRHGDLQIVSRPLTVLHSSRSTVE